MKREVMAVLAALPLLTVTGCSEGKLDHGKVFSKDRTDLSVRPGQTFSIRWKLYVTPGDDYKPADPAPDPAMVSFVGPDAIPGDDKMMGDGGELYLVFKAKGRGTTELAVENCWSCDPSAKESFHERRTYRVTVG